MPESDVLLTIAEVAVAFAGFASLVGVLGQRSSADDPRFCRMVELPNQVVFKPGLVHLSSPSLRGAPGDIPSGRQN